MGIACFHARARASPPRAQICCPCRTGPAGRAAVRNFAEQSARVPRTGSGKGRSGCRRSHMLWNCAARMSSPIGPPHAPRQRLAWVTAPESWREAQTFSCKHCKPNHFQGIVRYPSVWRLEGIPSPGKAELYLRLSLSQVKLSAFSLRLRRKKSGDRPSQGPVGHPAAGRGWERSTGPTRSRAGEPPNKASGQAWRFLHIYLKLSTTTSQVIEPVKKPFSLQHDHAEGRPGLLVVGGS